MHGEPVLAKQMQSNVAVVLCSNQNTRLKFFFLLSSLGFFLLSKAALLTLGRLVRSLKHGHCSEMELSDTRDPW